MAKHIEQVVLMGSRRAAGAATLALLCLGSVAHAQQDDVPLPPRIDDVGNAERPARIVPSPAQAVLASPIVAIEAQSLPGRAPRAARLAPLPEDRGAAPDEVVVIGNAEWRLPDLGGWRAEERAEERSRIRVTFLHLYDPDTDRQDQNPFLLNGEQQRFGELQILRWRFGRKPKD